MIKNTTRWPVLLITSILLSSCGFKLRSLVPFPLSWQPVEIQSLKQYDEIDVAIARAFDNRNITIVRPDREKDNEELIPKSRLQIRDEDQRLQDIAVGEANTKQLTIIWHFTLHTFDSTTSSWTEEIKRGFVSENTIFTILGNTNEANPEYREIVEELRDKVAEQLIRSISKTQ